MSREELRKGSLLRLKRDFEHGAQRFPDLRIVFWRIDRNFPNIPEARRDVAETNYGLLESPCWEQVLWSEPEIEIEERLPPEVAERLSLTPKKYKLGTVLSVYGSDEGWNRFRELGRRGGNCVRGQIPWEVPADHEPSGLYPELLWILALFGLSWERRPGLDLHASIDRFGGLCAPVPESFVSMLHDAFTASVVAIDVLLSECSPMTLGESGRVHSSLSPTGAGPASGNMPSSPIFAEAGAAAYRFAFDDSCDDEKKRGRPSKEVEKSPSTVAGAGDTNGFEADADAARAYEAQDKGRVPPEERTIPMSYRRAARLMGKGNSKDAAEWLSKSVRDGSIRCEHISRQTHVFSIRDFPKPVWPQILPRGAKPTDPNSP